MVLKINHVAVVLPKLEAGVGFWVDALGLPLAERRREESEGVDIAFLPVGESEIELIAPFVADNGVARYLDKKGGGLHHICFEVDDLDEALARLKAHQVPLIDEEPRSNAAGRRMLFIHPKGTGGVLVELYEQDAAAD